MMIYLLLISCMEIHFEQGTPFYDQPIDHSDDTFLFEPQRINKIEMFLR